MSEQTIRKCLKKLGLKLVVSTEMYSRAKCYAVMDNERPVMYFESLESLYHTFQDDFGA